MFGKKNSVETTTSSDELGHPSNTSEVSVYDNEIQDSVNDSFEKLPAESARKPEEVLEAFTTPIISKPSILSQGFEFEGSIKTTGALIISGRIIGNITAGVVTIENGGVVHGEIKADSLTVKGNLLGEIRCRELTVAANAHVDADSYFDTIEVHRGGKISGLLNKT